MSIQVFAENVLSKFSKSITDKVFLLIQNDRELMYEYLRLVHAHGPDSVNRQIGKEIKERYKLSNDVNRENNPASTLIQSHQTFE